MISARLGGKLGNQLFQMANCYSRSKEWGLAYAIEMPSNLKQVYGHFYKYKNINYCAEGLNLKKYKEPTFHFSPIKKYDNMVFEGGFQSYKYFDSYRQDIINIFSEITKDWQLKKGVVSIHIRRGDYLNFPNLHPIIKLDYIKKCVEYFLNLGIKNFMVFSDDIKWCELILINSNLAKYYFSKNENPIEDMLLMSCCEHNIISNSSFSWWAAYFNQNPDKIVIYPSVWFGEGYKHYNTKDLFPEKWIKI